MLWKGININASSKLYNLDKVPRIIGNKGSLTKDPWRLANEFNQFFTNVAGGITKKIARIPISPTSYLSYPNLNFFSISFCTSE